MTKKFHAFTLIELVLVMVIIGILSVILLRTYTWISQMTFRVQQTKNVQQEVLHLSQVMQNFADRNTIDFTRYNDHLKDTQGLTETLYLSGQDGTLKFYASGDCNPLVTSGQLLLTGSCTLMLEQSGVQIQLTDPHKVILGHVVFKIIPFASADAYLQSNAFCATDYLHCVHKPGFWILLDAYSINYGTQWATHVHIPLQLFY